MKKEQALNLIKQVCSIYKGTLEEHKMLQEAITILEKEEVKEPEIKE